MNRTTKIFKTKEEAQNFIEQTEVIRVKQPHYDELTGEIDSWTIEIYERRIEE